MKKIVWLLLAVVLVFAGCGIPVIPQQTLPTAEAESQATMPDGEVLWQETEDTKKYQGRQLRFWSILDEESAEAAVLCQAAAVFEEQYGAKVMLTFTAGDEEALAQALAKGRVDLIQTPNLKFVKENAEFLAELTAEKCDMTYLIQEELGETLCIPQTAVIRAFYYNKTAFENCGITKAPRTWAEFVKVCRTLKKNGWMPLTVDVQDAPVLTELLLRESLSQRQLQKLKEQGGWQESSQAMTVATEILDFLKAGYLAKGAPGRDSQSSRDLVLSDIAMVFSTNVEMAAAMRHAGTNLELGIFSCPGGNFVFDGQMLAVAAESAQQDVAADLIMLLTRGEFDQLYADVSGGIPVDRENVSLFMGTEEFLTGGSLMTQGWWSPEQEAILLQIWQSKYAKAEDFAAQLDACSQSVG